MKHENKYSKLDLAPNGVGTLTIQQAGKLNILSTDVMDALLETFTFVNNCPDVKVLILRGEGDRAFIAGADIKEMSALDAQSATVFIDKLRQLCDAPRLLRMPVIARIPGWTLGGGMEFALSCDLRVASTEARLGMPEVKVGIPSIIHAALIPRLIGKSRATWLLLTGEVVDAKTALSWGMLDEVVPPAELDAAVTRLADSLASLGPAVLAQQKRLLREWEDESLDCSIQNGVKEFASAFHTGEPQKYMGQFLKEKAERESR